MTEALEDYEDELYRLKPPTAPAIALMPQLNCIMVTDRSAARYHHFIGADALSNSPTSAKVQRSPYSTRLPRHVREATAIDENTELVAERCMFAFSSKCRPTGSVETDPFNSTLMRSKAPPNVIQFTVTNPLASIAHPAVLIQNATTTLAKQEQIAAQIKLQQQQEAKKNIASSPGGADITPATTAGPATPTDTHTETTRRLASKAASLHRRGKERTGKIGKAFSKASRPREGHESRRRQSTTSTKGTTQKHHPELFGDDESPKVMPVVNEGEQVRRTGKVNYDSSESALLRPKFRRARRDRRHRRKYRKQSGDRVLSSRSSADSNMSGVSFEYEDCAVLSETSPTTSTGFDSPVMSIPPSQTSFLILPMSTSPSKPRGLRKGKN